MKLVEFIVTFLTIRKIIEDVKDETIRTEADDGRGGSNETPGDIHKHPIPIREDGPTINSNGTGG